MLSDAFSFCHFVSTQNCLDPYYMEELARVVNPKIWTDADEGRIAI
jgi:hypothetical protein